MGVPVVTLAGSLPPGRVGLTHARNLELPEVIASSEADFAKTAANLAGDLESLARLRGSLRDRMVKSPLMDGARFTRAVEAGYRQAWREWCERGSAEG
jgi:predicted O-linked N-acetylglucosamine transferase (SPINDLY family)